MKGLPLVAGASGEAVRDLQRRLSGAGHDPGAIDGEFGPCTQAAVRAFQESRALHVDGVCGDQTWQGLVEAGFGLGDRLLYHRSPMLRGDDVEELQRCLDALGFDPRWIDGIFGEWTAHALVDFQRNFGLTADGICGPDTIASLRRLGTRLDAPGGVAEVRHREHLRAGPKTLEARRLVVGHDGTIGVLATASERLLAGLGAVTAVIGHPDPSARAAQANEFGAEIYLGLAVADRTEIGYYRSQRFESTGGRHLAELIPAHLPPVLEPAQVVGLRVPILRETRMPAVQCQLGPAAAVVEHARDIATALATAVSAWAVTPVNEPGCSG